MLKPTEKAQGIIDLLTAVTGVSREEAAAHNICVWCKEPHTPFRDARSAKEADISGFCQGCQDETFGSGR